MSIQTDFFEVAISNQQKISNLPNTDLTYLENFISSNETTKLMSSIQNSYELNQQCLKVYNKQHLTPRLVAWCANPEISYRYSNDTLIPQPWTLELLSVKQKIETALNTQFNGVLINYYRDGNDSMGWHRDNEEALGKTPVIASLSLGAQRSFQLRSKNYQSQCSIELKDGSLFVMKGETQTYWQHCLPKRKRVKLPRINLTFRLIHIDA